MSGLTPEAARAAAEWILANYAPYTITAVGLRAEADRLENAAKTPGQVAFHAYHALWADMPSWDVNGPVMRAQWDAAAAAVIAHVVGPDRVVVDQADAEQAVAAFGNGYTPAFIDRLREALS